MRGVRQTRLNEKHEGLAIRRSRLDVRSRVDCQCVEPSRGPASTRSRSLARARADAGHHAVANGGGGLRDGWSPDRWRLAPNARVGSSPTTQDSTWLEEGEDLEGGAVRAADRHRR